MRSIFIISIQNFEGVIWHRHNNIHEFEICLISFLITYSAHAYFFLILIYQP